MKIKKIVKEICKMELLKTYLFSNLEIKKEFKDELTEILDSCINGEKEK